MVFNLDLENRWWLDTGLEWGGGLEGMGDAVLSVLADKRLRFELRRSCSRCARVRDSFSPISHHLSFSKHWVISAYLHTKVWTLSLKRMDSEWNIYMKKIEKLTCRPYVCHEIENYCLFTTFLFPHPYTHYITYILELHAK